MLAKHLFGQIIIVVKYCFFSLVLTDINDTCLQGVIRTEIAESLRKRGVRKGRKLTGVG